MVCIFILTANQFAFTQESNRFENDIHKFEIQDQANPPDKNLILFTGSSSIRFWKTLKSDFEGHNVLNRGFGGSEFSDLIYFYERIVLSYKPFKVFLYEGDNDVANGKMPQVILKDFQTLVDKIHTDLPNTKIYFISIKPSPSRWHLKDKIEEANDLIRKQCEKNDLLEYIDIYTPMIKNKRPYSGYFIGDSLHMSPLGYDLWAEKVAPYIDQD